MLTAEDFRFIYKNGKLPSGLELINKAIPVDTVGPYAEWICIENRFNSLAKSLIKDRDSVKRHPPSFTTDIKYLENLRKLTQLGFKLSLTSVIMRKSFDSCSYYIEF